VLVRFARQVSWIAVLALYAVCFLSGRPVHYLQCTEERATPSGTAKRQAVSDCSHPHSHSDTDGDRAPSDNPGHDSSHCYVCQVLGQAQDTTAEVTIVSAELISPVQSDRVPDFYPTPSQFGFRSRAPPVA
jgi:hypothetical protein